MKVEVLPGFESLDEGRWNGLLAQARYPSVFLSWQWQTAWARAFLGERPLHLLRVTDDAGTLAGVLPLYDESAGLRRFVGGVDVSDYLDVIAPACREADVWHALLQHRAGEAAEWDLHAIRAASPTLEILPRLCDAAGIRAQSEREDRCPVTPTSSVSRARTATSCGARFESWSASCPEPPCAPTPRPKGGIAR
jgi:CelD/BcsL family acetyltransferase involved in cellulose biosynthesis